MTQHMEKSKPIYTRRGDGGQTDCPGQGRVGKDALQMEVWGTLDELNAHLGLLAAWLDGRPERVSQLQYAQQKLFALGRLLMPPYDGSPLAEAAAQLEQWIDGMAATLPALHDFILPGGSRPAAQAHVCRTVCRRLERCWVRAVGTCRGADDEHALAFVNRLSDYLFTLARLLNA